MELILVDYDVLLAPKFAQLSKNHYEKFSNITKKLKKFKKAYSKGVLHNALINYFMPKYDKTYYHGTTLVTGYYLQNYLLLHNIMLLEYSGNIIIEFMNNSIIELEIKSTSINFVVFYKLLNIIKCTHFGKKHKIRLIPSGFVKEIRFSNPANFMINGHKKISRNTIY